MKNNSNMNCNSRELEALKLALEKQLTENKTILNNLKTRVKDSPELLIRCEYFIGVIKGLEIALKLIKE